MDRKTIKTYDILAAEYDAQTANFWQRVPQTIFIQFVQSVGQGKVIDIGSGPGRDGLLSSYGFEVSYFEQVRPSSKTYLHFIAKKPPV